MRLTPTSCDLLRSSHGQGVRIVSYASTFADLHLDAAHSEKVALDYVWPPHDLTQVGREAATGDARRLLAQSRLPPIRGYTPSAPRYGLPGVGCLKQMTNAVFQQSDGPLQGAELSDPHYRDGQAQVK